MNKNNKLKCIYCNKEFMAVHRDKKFCNKNCEWAYGYKFGNRGKNSRARIKEKQVERFILIGKCELCEISYLEIKTMKDLGSTMMNAASVFHKDHILPQSKGGQDTPENTRYLCWFCNMSRKDMDSKYDEAIKQSSIAFWKEIKLLAKA